MLSNVETTPAQEQDSNLRVVMECFVLVQNDPYGSMCELKVQRLKPFGLSYFILKIRDRVLLRCCKNEGFLDEWQVMAPQTVRTCIFQECHHHKLAAHQGVVRTQALIKWRFYWPNLQKDIESWCQWCTVCGKCKAAVRDPGVRGHGQLQQPTYGAFDERVCVDLMGPFKTTQNGNGYIIVMQDHFTKWVEGRAICGKEALTVADAVV